MKLGKLFVRSEKKDSIVHSRKVVILLVGNAGSVSVAKSVGPK